MPIISSNIPKMSTGKMAETLASAYVGLINGGKPLRLMPSVMLWGAPGVGKSQGVRHIAELIGQRTGKRVTVTDVRLLLFNPIDLRGIPTANAEKTLTVWLKPKIFDMDPSEGVVNILFLDEISAAPQSVQAAAYQITLDRVVGEHKLPENCIVISAGNRLTDKSVAYKMPKALANRLMHIEIDADFDSWLEWAVVRGINPRVIGFLSFKRDYFIEEVASEDLAYPTPRSWEMVSNVLNSVDPDSDSVFSLVSGLVGVGIAEELRSFFELYRDLPSVESIFLGKAVAVPKRADLLYALTSSMTAYARKVKDDMPKIEASIRFAMGMPPDFSAILLRSYMYLEAGYKQRLMRLPSFARWAERAGKFL